MTCEVRAAFARAVAVMSNPASKSKGNFGRYCQLDDLADHVRPLLAVEGLALHQELRSDIVAGVIEIVTLVTSLETGAFVEVSRVAFPAKADAMKVGGDVTYYRRYSILSVCGIAGADDIEQASKAPTRPGKASNDQPSTVRPSGEISAAQLKALQTRYSATPRAERLQIWAGMLGRTVASAKELTKREAVILLTEDVEGGPADE